MRPLVALGAASLLAAGLSTSALPGPAAAAPLYPKMDWKPTGAHAFWIKPTCGTTMTQEFTLPKASRYTLTEPRAGDRVINYLDSADLGVVTQAGVMRTGGKATLRLGIRGGGDTCSTTPPSGGTPLDNGGTMVENGLMFWHVAVWRELPRGVRRFHAWTPEDKPAIPIERRRRGRCTESFVNIRADTWRCFVGRYMAAGTAAISGGSRSAATAG